VSYEIFLDLLLDILPPISHTRLKVLESIYTRSYIYTFTIIIIKLYLYNKRPKNTLESNSGAADNFCRYCNLHSLLRRVPRTKEICAAPRVA